MEEKSAFSEILEFFQGRQMGVPGDPDYNAAFCHCLVKAASAEEGSIWRLAARILCKSSVRNLP